MANFSESRIQSMIIELRDEYGPEIATRELAILELEDMARKGCTHESANKFDQCHDCPNSEKCPVLDWQKRHPEYANDELAMKIKVLEAGGEEAYKEKMKRQEELLKKAEENAQKATDADRANACRHLLDLFRKSKLTATEGGVLDLIENILNAKTKADIWDEVNKTM